MTTDSQLRTERVPTARLHSAPHNPRLIRDARFEQLKRSLVADPEMLDARPIIALPSGEVVAGNMRLRAALALGWDVVPCITVDLDERRAREWMLKDNNAWGEWQEDDLAALVYDLGRQGAELELLGFDPKELTRLMDSVGALGEADDVVPEPPAEPITRPGDLWLLGPHRLLCGDATRPEDVARVMDGRRASLCVTSPPYWIGREYEREHGRREIEAHIAQAAESIAGAIPDSGHIALNTGTTVETKQGGVIRRVWLLLDWWAEAFERQEWYMRNVRIWKKEGGFSSFAPSQDVVGQDWEFLASFTRAKPRPQNRLGDRWALDGVWNCQPQTAGVGHSAPFPTEIPGRFVALYTDTGDVVFDPYLGAGTTLVAAHEAGRVCCGLDIEPRSCDVAVQRWERLTGDTARREAVEAGA